MSVQCRKFSGLSTENASRFLSEFEPYGQLYGIGDFFNDSRIPAFHLLLQGAALSWFNAMPSSDRQSWDTFLDKSRFK